jgi:adenylate cyclase
MPFISSKSRRVLRKLLVSLLISAFAFGCALLTRVPGALNSAMQAVNNLCYDICYRLRPIEDQTNGPVVIVAADDPSLEAVNKTLEYGWPWPRELWGAIATYVSDAGAKAVVFDLLMSETSSYKAQGDDDSFAAAIGSIKTPVIFGSLVSADGTFSHFAPPIPRPHLAAVNVNDEEVYRHYSPVVYGKDSLALTVAKLMSTPAEDRFLLHYYGPNISKAGQQTFRYLSAANVLEAQVKGKVGEERTGISPAIFKDKIVIFGAITQGTYDLKSTPLSDKYPGVEGQATAIVNLLRGEHVTPISNRVLMLVSLLCAGFVAVGVVLPRNSIIKLLAPSVAVVVLLGLTITLFRQSSIHWLAPGESLLVILLSTPLAFSYSVLLEDRQRRFMLKALSKVVSPAIAEQLAQEPERLALGTVRTDVTVLFTDLANFTTLSESMEDQQVGELLNRYLGAMSDQVFLQNGTLDKYIGDAVMCFWNAPLPQEGHAKMACRAALAMVRREMEIRKELGALGEKLFTRIGINSTSAAVGFVGSAHLLNYTAIGDGVNLASRLEGANKIYGTRILISQATANLVTDAFVLRRIDTLKVKGKQQGVPIYELVDERNALPYPQQEKIALYEAGLDAYHHQDWELAERNFLELNARFGEDSAAVTLLKRLAILRQSPPPADWDGAYEAREK